MIICAISALDPRMVAGVKKYIARCAEEGIPTIVLETARELSTQIAYHLRGRAPVEEVRLVFARCGLWPISDMEAQVQSTKTLYSKHIDRLAADIAPAKDGKPWWDAPRGIWLAMFAIAEDECGLDACAGGKWQAWQWDWPHHEFREEIT